jgi:type II secretory pathway component PulM
VAKRQLTKRERIVVIGGGALVAALLLYELASIPIGAYRESEQALAEAEQRLQDARLMHEEVVAVRSTRQALMDVVRRRGSFDLISFVRGALARAGIDAKRYEWQKVDRPADGLTSMDLTLSGVSLQELLDALHTILGGGNLVAVDDMDLRPAPDGKGMICDVTLITPVL